MTLLIAVFAAVITTIIWYTNDKRSQLKLGTLALMYWGASLMWMVDAVVECTVHSMKEARLTKRSLTGQNVMHALAVVHVHLSEQHQHCR